MNKPLIDMSDLIEPPMKDVSPHHVKAGVSELLRRLEETDFQVHTSKYSNEVDLLSQDLSAQLRHRAYMMRLRADEFDELATSLESLSKRVVDHSATFFSSTEDVKTLLQEHAHINPTKVETGITTTIKY